jgi:transposase
MQRQLTAAHDNYLARRIGEGCTNAALLWRELREQADYRGGQTALRERVRRLQAGSASERRVPAPSALRVTWWLLAEEPESEPQAYLAALYRTDAKIEQMGRLARTFRRILRERDPDALDGWLEQADHSLLRRFATGLRQDYDAVHAAASLPWSNGPVEGQVNRLKLLKRRMYGRASFDLLRAHVLAAA